MPTTDSPIAAHLAARAQVASSQVRTPEPDETSLWEPLEGHTVAVQPRRALATPEWDVLPRRILGSDGDDTVLVRMVRQRVTSPSTADLGGKVVLDLRLLTHRVNLRRRPLIAA